MSDCDYCPEWYHCPYYFPGCSCIDIFDDYYDDCYIDDDYDQYHY